MLVPTSRRAASRARLLVGWALGLALLALVFGGADWKAIASELRSADPWRLSAALTLSVLGAVLRAGRWRLLFWPRHRLDGAAVFDALSVGYLVNNLVPARAGDLARCFLVSRWAGVPVSHALSTTFIERVLDALLMVGLFFGVLPFLALPPAAVGIAAAIGGGLVVALAAFLVAAARRESGPQWIARLLGRLPGIDPERWSGRIGGLLAGAAVLRDPRALVRLSLWMTVVWGQSFLVYWLVIAAFGVEVTGAMSALAMVAGALGFAVVVAPSGLGTFEGAVVGALVVTGVAADAARGVAVALHANILVALTAVGIWSLVRRGLIRRAERRRAWEELGEVVLDASPAAPPSERPDGGPFP